MNVSSTTPQRSTDQAASIRQVVPHNGASVHLPVTDAIGAIIERRLIIEQTKGMLMFSCGVSADEAFALLRKQSQDHNVKVFLLATQVRKELLERSWSNASEHRTAVEGILRSAHRRCDTPQQP